MKNRFVKLLMTGIVITSLSLNVCIAHAYDFDANYYARKYPDVVAVVGNDPTALYNHYLNNGIKEGRYICQAEESEYAAKGIMKSKEVSAQQQVQAQAPAKTTTPTVTVTTPTGATSNDVMPVPPIKAPYVTYVDIDKTNQVVTYFENGVVKFQSWCVTGNERAGHGTPCGTFTMLQHTTNKYLIGPTWRAWVSYWMKFTTDGCGLHDSSWRSSYGGDIYKTSGSHGCVNMPYDAAKQLYEYTSIGTVVYVHD